MLRTRDSCALILCLRTGGVKLYIMIFSGKMPGRLLLGVRNMYFGATSRPSAVEHAPPLLARTNKENWCLQQSRTACMSVETVEDSDAEAGRGFRHLQLQQARST